MKETLITTSHKAFLEALTSGDHPYCSRYARNYLSENHSIQDLYENVLKKSLYDVGKLWEYNQISVAAEHLASAIIEAILNEFYHQVASGEKTSNSVIISCIEEELHQIGGKMINDVFEMQGWNTYFLGANTPVKELIDYTKLIQPDLIAVSLTIYFHLPTLEDLIQRVRKEFPKLRGLGGGQGFEHGGKEILNQYDHVFYKSNLKSVESFIKEYSGNG